MGKKLAFLMILVMLCASLIFAVSCLGGGTSDPDDDDDVTDDGNGDEGDEGEDAAWKNNDTHHWKKSDKSDKEEHSFGDWTVSKAASCTTAGTQKRTCDDCEYEEEGSIDPTGHKFGTTWSKDEYTHWHATTCGHDAKGDEAEHTFENGKCTVCKAEQSVTAGFVIEKISNTACRIVGVEDGVTFRGAVIMPSYFDKSETFCKVTEIAPGAFVGQDKMTDVSIPATVKTIGDGAFDGCTALKSMTIGDAVTKLGAYAFRNCMSLETVVIGAKVTKILNNTFDGCVALTAVTIPEKVTEIGAYAFNGCTALATVTYETTALKTINARAFADCVALANVTIPATVTKVGGSAYANTAFANNASNKVDGILYCGTVLLKADTNLTGEITVKADTTLIADRAFEDCKLITNVNTGTASIGKNVFDGCDKITDTGVYVEEGDFLFKQVDAAYELISYSGTATEVTLPASIKGGSYAIGAQAFAGNKDMTTVIIPAGVTAIGAQAFSGCAELVTVKIGNTVTSVGEKAFRYCNKINNIYITDLAAWCEITFADKSAHPFNYYFEGEDAKNHLYLNDTEVTAMTIPAGVTAIGDWAFFNCDGITSVTIDNSVESIGKGAFRIYGVGGLTSVTVSTTGWVRGAKLGGTGVEVDLTAEALKGDETYYYYIKN